jgi:hypothetical protein
MGLVVTRETLAWAYTRTLLRIYPEHYKPENLSEETIRDEHREETLLCLRAALCGSDLTVDGLRLTPATEDDVLYHEVGVEKIPLAVWYNDARLPTERLYNAIALGQVYAQPGPWDPYDSPQRDQLDAVEPDPVDPSEVAAAVNQAFKRYRELQHGDIYLHPTVACAEVHAWHSRASPPSLLKSTGGRPPLFDWERIWFLMARDLWENGLPPTVAEMVERIQSVCRANDIKEPSEDTLRPKARRFLGIMRPDETDTPPSVRA